MKKILCAVLGGFALFSVNTSFAKSDTALLKEAEKNVVTIAQAKKLSDESGVTLKGKITKHIAGDDFELSDSTGAINIDVDDDLWKPLKLKVGDQVHVVGEVDTHRIKSTDIDVIHIERTK
ncbi:NirD/YgiW/YdeI family stress tolerance protein [Acinetobacter sp. YH12052]|uniref:NirD/YgiW/YdeI family stress tolerance protein n=1 Tax=Acinetobacter sp. YH12052 TaxID=2601055 RepID=UPI0015D146F6|nr:NirD/YgiW/YdeI family stress tolerance protein [Acinetobacter sp. YH12052]